MMASSRPLIKVMTPVNKVKAGSESESIPSADPCNSHMPAEPATCYAIFWLRILSIYITGHPRTTLVPSVNQNVLVRAPVTAHRKQINSLRVTVPEMTE